MYIKKRLSILRILGTWEKYKTKTLTTERKIELLAPAKNLECGIEAINHGADAVYIGAPQFSARAAAGNTLEDIKALAAHAHLFNARVYVALNTILNDEELQATEKLIWQLWDEAKVDALIVQDMGVTMLNLPPIPLHASTQMDNRTPGKVKFLEDAGFRQIVLARELTLKEIANISKEVTTPLEIFVHGALCVCYSGQCYLSEALSKRSANKGSCAQYCRLPYDLSDTNGEELLSKKHLLSMKDLNLSDDLEALLDAGASSLKIEGRLKDVSYVKNTVAYYRQKLDKIFARRPEYSRISSGYSTINFTPNLAKSFNRGFTKYFLYGRTHEERIWSVDSPKSIGESIGTVQDVTKQYIRLNTDKTLNNGDGLCYFDAEGELQGIQVNRAEHNLVYPYETSAVKKGTQVFRNYDHEFEKALLRNNTGERKILTRVELSESPKGYTLTAVDEDNITVSLEIEYAKELAKKDQTENIKNNMSKTGNTIFEVKQVSVKFSDSWFLPSSVISEWRRLLMDKLLQTRIDNYQHELVEHKQTFHAFPTKSITYLGNVMNDKSKLFYIQHQSNVLQPAFEKQAQKDVPLMFTRHCVKQSLGWCPIEGGEKHPYKEPFYLTYKGTQLQLTFDCKNCEMKVFNVVE